MLKPARDGPELIVERRGFHRQAVKNRHHNELRRAGLRSCNRLSARPRGLVTVP
jgi:hypothetical protein